MPRNPLAFVLVGVMSLLAAGGAVLGVLQAPTPDDLTVHNGAGETLAAPNVDGRYSATNLGRDVIAFRYVAPDRVTEVALGPTGAVKARRTVVGPPAVLSPLRQVLAESHFRTLGGTYVSLLPVATIVPASQRALVTGTYRTSVDIASGYVVEVDIAITATEAGQHISERADFRLTRVGTWRRH
jgi:hypothetical protein